MDVIASWQTRPRVRREEFQVWKLTVDKKKNEGVIVAEDGDGNKIATQRIPYTDFPLDEITLYYKDNVIMLPSEY